MSGGSMEEVPHRGDPEHGGDLEEARRLFPGAPEPWIDLSTGINAHPYPLPPCPSSLIERLPPPADLLDLERIAAETYGASDAAGVVAAPGTGSVIGLLPLIGAGTGITAGARVAVLGPTYGEHARAWAQAGPQVREVPDLEQAADADVVVAVNPNNPDGRRLPRGRLLALAGDLASRGGLLVVDEAFADLDGSESLVPALPASAVVLRSFGKAYGLAGLRLGFAVAEPSLAARLRVVLGPWRVSGPALHAGRLALRDRAWLDAAREARERDAARLDRLLAPLAEAPPAGTSLFRLIETGRAPLLFRHLGERGIFARRFADRPTSLRLGLPGPEAAWDRVEAALHDLPRA